MDASAFLLLLGFLHSEGEFLIVGSEIAIFANDMFIVVTARYAPARRCLSTEAHNFVFHCVSTVLSTFELRWKFNMPQCTGDLPISAIRRPSCQISTRRWEGLPLAISIASKTSRAFMSSEPSNTLS